MFQELIELLKRYVTAHEKLAEATMLVAQEFTNAPPTARPDMGCFASPDLPGVSDGSECTAGQPVTATEVAAQQQAAPATPPSGKWDPYTTPVQNKYGADKQAIIKAELRKYGIDPGTKLTGRELHDMLLEQAKSKPVPPPAELPETTAAPAPPVAPVMAPPAAPAAPAAPVPPVATAGEISLGMIRGALNNLALKGPAAQAEVMRLLNEVGGVSRLTDAATGKQLLPADKFEPLYYAVTEAAGRF